MLFLGFIYQYDMSLSVLIIQHKCKTILFYTFYCIHLAILFLNYRQALWHRRGYTQRGRFAKEETKRTQMTRRHEHHEDYKAVTASRLRETLLARPGVWTQLGRWRQVQQVRHGKGSHRTESAAGKHRPHRPKIKFVFIIRTRVLLSSHPVPFR